jgi:hypothetical protein
MTVTSTTFASLALRPFLKAIVGAVFSDSALLLLSIAAD